MDRDGVFWPFPRNAMHMAATLVQDNTETAAMLADKIFLRELNSVPVLPDSPHQRSH